MFFAFGTFPRVFLQQGLNEMNPFLVNFEALCFHIHFYFPMKESNNLALMVALAKPPFRVLAMAPKLFAMQFTNLVVS